MKKVKKVKKALGISIFAIMGGGFFALIIWACHGNVLEALEMLGVCVAIGIVVGIILAIPILLALWLMGKL